MPRKRILSDELLLAAMARLQQIEPGGVTSSALSEATGVSLAVVKRALVALLEQGQVSVTGKARATRYQLASAPGTAPQGLPVPGVAEPSPAIAPSAHPNWSHASLALREWLTQPLASRPPVTYRRALLEQYQPNISSLLPTHLAHELASLGSLSEQLPAGTYMRKVLEPLLIDLSWSSSHLEGNRYSLLDTEQLFKDVGLKGAIPLDADATMLLNHKAAIEFMVDAVPTQGLTTGVVRNLHAVLMQDLLTDVSSLGTIRSMVVNISGSVYLPLQMPALLQEMFERTVLTARSIRNPVEAAFFLWVQLAYLQPFADGNKRVSRLAANMPLMLCNHSPISFLDVDRNDYAMAMLGVYERGDFAMAIDLFEWTYRRSIARYRVVLEAAGQPDVFRIRHRAELQEVLCAVVRDRRALSAAVADLTQRGVAAVDLPRLHELASQELEGLAEHNCARWRLGLREVQLWIGAGRPRD